MMMVRAVNLCASMLLCADYGHAFLAVPGAILAGRHSPSGVSGFVSGRCGQPVAYRWAWRYGGYERARAIHRDALFAKSKKAEESEDAQHIQRQSHEAIGLLAGYSSLPQPLEEQVEDLVTRSQSETSHYLGYLKSEQEQQGGQHHHSCDPRQLEWYKYVASTMQEFIFRSFLSSEEQADVEGSSDAGGKAWFVCFCWSSGCPEVVLRYLRVEDIKCLNGWTAGGLEDHYYGPFASKEHINAVVTMLKKIFLLDGIEAGDAEAVELSADDTDKSRKRSKLKWQNALEYGIATALAEEVWIGQRSSLSNLHFRRVCDKNLVNADEPSPRLLNHLAACSDGITRATLKMDGLREIKRLLQLPKLPRRIEGYDISHIQGFGAVASRSVFVDGEAAPEHYRWYRITNDTVRTGHSDDYASLAEMITARFSPKAAPTADGEGDARPDLVLIDGGKGQLSAVMRALGALGLDDQHTVALAKQREEIYTPNAADPLHVEGGANSPGMLILRQCRDEAHAFAVYYHRHVRSTEHLKSAFDGIHMMSKEQRRLLLENFKSIQAVASASVEELASVSGIDQRLASTLHTHFRTETAAPEAGVAELNEHRGGKFQASTLLLNGRQNISQLASKVRTLRSKNRWILERSLHLNRLSSPEHADGILKAMQGALAAWMPRTNDALNMRTAPLRSTVARLPTTRGDTSTTKYLTEVPNNCTDPDDLLSLLASMVLSRSAVEVKFEEQRFQYHRTGQRLFALSSEGGGGADEASEISAAVVVCDGKQVFDRRNAETAIELVDRWHANVRQSRQAELDPEAVRQSKQADLDPEAAAVGDQEVGPESEGVVLSPEQSRAVQAEVGPVLVLAGPGSGKTRVLTHRILHLIESGRASASEFLVLTFTNKAAAELRQRLSALLGPQHNHSHLTAGTFHAVCSGVLRRHGWEIGVSPRFSVYGADEQKQAMAGAIASLGDAHPAAGELKPMQVLSVLSRLRAASVTSEVDEAAWESHRAVRGRRDAVRAAVRAACEEYTRILDRCGALDFDMLILKTLDLLSTRPTVGLHP